MQLIESFAEFVRLIAGILWTATYIHQSILRFVHDLIHVRARFEQKSLKDNCKSASKKSELDEADSGCSRTIVVRAQVHQENEETTENHKKFKDPFVTLNMPGTSNCYETEPEYEQIKYESFSEIKNVDYDEINVMDSDYSDSVSYDSVSDVTIIEMQKPDMSDDGYYENSINNAESSFDPIYWISNHQTHPEYVTINPTNEYDVDSEHKRCSCGSCLWSCFKKI